MNAKGPCDGCDCDSGTCPCFCVCEPCECECITLEAAAQNKLNAKLDSVIALRRVKDFDLHILAAVLDANSNAKILIPANRVTKPVTIEFVGGTLREALDQLELPYTED